MADAVWSPNRGEIIWIDFNPQVGQEMRNRHPMLVLSPKHFNQRTSLVIGLPMTTASSNQTNPFAIAFKGIDGVISYILAHQPKSFDWRQRAAKTHPQQRVPKQILCAVCERLNQIITLCEID